MEKKIYVAPELEIVEVKVELGFAESVEPGWASNEGLDDNGYEIPW